MLAEVRAIASIPGCAIHSASPLISMHPVRASISTQICKCRISARQFSTSRVINTEHASTTDLLAAMRNPPRSRKAETPSLDMLVKRPANSTPYIRQTTPRERSVDDRWAESTRMERPLIQGIPARPTPYSSRSVKVTNSILSQQRNPSASVSEIGTAWKKLHVVMAESNVKKELKRGERYEKPTLMRQRLASERHRRRFKVEVGRQISELMRLKKKGLVSACLLAMP